jgi:hypothetical protein
MHLCILTILCFCIVLDIYGIFELLMNHMDNLDARISVMLELTAL